MIKVGTINTQALELAIKKVNPIIDNASIVLGNELHKAVKPFTPYRSGDLERSFKFVKEGNRIVAILYDIKYAKRMYYGDDNWNYTKDINKQACPRWVERGWAVYGKSIVDNVNKALKNGI